MTFYAELGASELRPLVGEHDGGPMAQWMGAERQSSRTGSVVG
jgi:hypothetical protein